ncbi:DUF3105 domain-containing protein [Nocardia yunnanensis]|uniref:DUF3105 domain-containing protein n=1 Tax=Nocardia yunnanensis TaxID=2382165 RepID=A0A386ZEN8_9NOCA|nr:DUF3105 domain-containing protein [Nocardia yunnanensis]AYF74959.1 DUF3105 domain-containing protein [Nocardia yunnanensis]
MPSKTSAKSAKAIKAAGKSAGSRKGGGGAKLGGKRQVPWLMIGAVVCVLALIGGIAWVIVPRIQDRRETTAAQTDVKEFVPSPQQKDPSDRIPGVVKKEYPAGMHVTAKQRVAYDQSPPFGGPHDGSWAACTGVVYPKAIRTENAVHALEHGAIWIAYNPDKLGSSGVDELKHAVKGRPYMLMSPYPGLDKPISLQSWGHQLKLDSADDARVKQFITALRLNQNTYPEVGADCANPTFDVNNPPPFDASAPGPDAVPMSGTGATQAQDESGGMPAGGIPGLPNGIPGLPGGTPTLPGGVPTIPAPDAQTDAPTQPEQPAPTQ